MPKRVTLNCVFDFSIPARYNLLLLLNEIHLRRNIEK